MEFDEILFGLGAILFVSNWIAFSLVACTLLLTITRDAPSKRSFRLSPIIRKFGKRIQHVFTVHDPDIPWHLHSWRISLWTCCKKKRKKNVLINWKRFLFCFGTMKLLKIDTIHVYSKQTANNWTELNWLGLFHIVFVSCSPNQCIYNIQQHEMSSFRWNYIIFMFTTNARKNEINKMKCVWAVRTTKPKDDEFII